MKVARITDGHSSESVPMVRSRHVDDGGFFGFANELPVLEAEFEGDLYGGRAIVAEDNACQLFGGVGCQPLHQSAANRMAESKPGRVCDVFELFIQSAVEIRIAMAVDVGPDGCVAVKVSPAFGVV